MELYLLKIYKVSRKFETRSFWTLPVPDSFNLHFLLFYIFLQENYFYAWASIFLK